MVDDTQDGTKTKQTNFFGIVATVLLYLDCSLSDIWVP
jgi:hypothetical protein